MRFADSQKLDDEGFSGFDFDGDFLPGLQAVEECRGGQDADVGIGLPEFGELAEDLRIEKVAEEIVAADRVREFFLKRVFFLVKVRGREIGAGAAAQWRFAAENNLLQFPG